MSGAATEELKRTLDRLEKELEAVRARRAARRRDASAPAPMPEPSLPPAGAPAKPPVPVQAHYAAAGGCLIAAAAGAGLDNGVLTAAGLLCAVGYLAWRTAPAAEGREKVRDLAPRLAALERRVASLSSVGGGAGFEEELRELRTILESLMRALEEPPPADGKAR